MLFSISFIYGLSLSSYMKNYDLFRLDNKCLFWGVGGDGITCNIYNFLSSNLKSITAFNSRKGIVTTRAIDK